MGQELGLQGLAIPEEYGGQGFTFIELGIVLEEMGRVLLCAPYFSSVVLAANAILERGHRRAEGGAAARHRDRRHDRRRSRSPSRPASGTRPASRSRPRREGDDFTLSGEKMFVIDGHIADLIVVVARTRGHDRDRRHLVLHRRRRRQGPDPHAALRRWT